MRQNNHGSQTDRGQQGNPLQNQQLQHITNQGNQTSRGGHAAAGNHPSVIKSYFEHKGEGSEQAIRNRGPNGTSQEQHIGVSGMKPSATSRQPRQVQINQSQVQKQQPQPHGAHGMHSNTEIKNMVGQQNNQVNSQGGMEGYQPLRNMQRSNTAGKHGAQQQLTINQGQNIPTSAVGHRTGGLKFKSAHNPHMNPPNSNPNFPSSFDPQMNATAGQIQSNQHIQPALSPRLANPKQPGRPANVVHQSHDGILNFTQARNPEGLATQKQPRSIKSTRQVNVANQQANAVSNIIGQNNTPQLSSFHPPSAEMGNNGANNSMSKGRQRYQNIKQQQFDDRYGPYGDKTKLRATTTSEARKQKEQQQNKGDKRGPVDKNLILAVSHNNKQNEAPSNPHNNRYSPASKRLLMPVDQHPLSVSQDRPVSKRGPVEDPFFPEGTGSKHMARQGQPKIHKNSNLAIQATNSLQGFQQPQQLTERGGQQSSHIQAQTLASYDFQNPQQTPVTSRGVNGQSGTVSNQNHNIPQIRKANLRELRKNHRLQQNNLPDSRGHPHLNTIHPLTTVELAGQFNPRDRAAHAFKNTGTMSKTNETLSPPSKDMSPLGQQQQIPLKSSRNKEVQRSLDSRRQILPHGGFMKDGPFGGGNQITPTSNHNQVNRSQDFSRMPDQNKSQSSDNRVSNVAQILTQGQLRNKRGKKTATNQSYSHGQMQNELIRELGLTKTRKQLGHADEASHQNNPLSLNPPGRPLVPGLQSERHKRTRQSFPVASTLNGLSARGNSHQDIQQPGQHQHKQKHEQQQNRDNTSVAASRKQLDSVGKERFNAITKFAFATSCGHQPGNPYKVNQDTYTLTPNMCGQQGFHLFTVCDGHGVNGHKVSGDIKTELPKLLENRLKQDKDFLENTNSQEFQDRLPKYFRDCFEAINVSFFDNSKPFDCHLSGSTVTSVLFDSKRIYCANAGDSRAVLYTQKTTGGIRVTPLSEDHKPDLPKERDRVEKCGGRVEPILGPAGQYLGPQRVWLLNEDTPGLAMSRSLGDGLAHSVGVSWEPEVKQLNLEPADKFIVIASDGVWEFLSNEAIARIVWPYYVKNSPEQAGNAIVRAAAQKWKENDTVIDDITCITIFLEVE